MRRTNLLILLVGAVCRYADAAAFQNLDLESANTNAVRQLPELHPPYLRGGGPITELLPGWQFGAHKQRIDFGESGIAFNGTCIGSLCSSLVSRDAASDFPYIPFSGTQGNYWLLMAVGELPEGISYTLKQTGDVPVEAKILDADVILIGFASMDIFLNGELIQQRKGRNVVSNKDISAFAGKNVDLEIKFYSTETFPPAGPIALLNGVQFLSQPAIRALVTPLGLGNGYFVEISFSPITEKNFIVEATDDPARSDSWQALPGAPHNTGYVTEQTKAAQRFYRLRVTDP